MPHIKRMLPKEIGSLYLEGKPIWYLAKEFSSSFNTVKRNLAELGIKVRDKKEALILSHPSRIAGLPWDDIVDTYVTRRMKVKDLAIKYGCSRTLLSHRLETLGARRRGLKGQNNGNWNGGISIHEGYVLVKKPEHPATNYKGYVLRSRLVWEKAHGRLLPKGWVIHHVDGIKEHDIPENLMAYPRLKHTRLLPLLLRKIKRLQLENRALKASQGILPLESLAEKEVL